MSTLWSALNAAGGGDFWSLWAPTIMQLGSPFISVNDGVTLRLVGWHVGLAAVVFFVWSVWGLRARSAVPVVVLLSSVALLASSGAALAMSPRILGTRTTFTYACAGSAPEVCVHPAYAKGLPALQSAFGPVVDHLEGSRLAVLRTEQHLRDGSSSGRTDVKWYAFDNLESGFERFAAIELILAIAPVMACRPTASNDPREQNLRSQLVVGAWLLSDRSQLDGDGDDGSRLYEWLSGLQREARIDWLNKHASDIAACQLRSESFQ